MVQRKAVIEEKYGSSHGAHRKLHLGKQGAGSKQSDPKNSILSYHMTPWRVAALHFSATFHIITISHTRKAGAVHSALSYEVPTT